VTPEIAISSEIEPSCARTVFRTRARAKLIPRARAVLLILARRQIIFSAWLFGGRVGHLQVCIFFRCPDDLNASPPFLLRPVDYRVAAMRTRPRATRKCRSLMLQTGDSDAILFSQLLFANPLVNSGTCYLTSIQCGFVGLSSPPPPPPPTPPPPGCVSRRCFFSSVCYLLPLSRIPSY